MAGPDGGDGGNGGHVIFLASYDVNSLEHIDTVMKADSGEKGFNKDCHGKNAEHTVIKVPVGTIIRSEPGNIVADLDREGVMYIAARGGAGGKGNHYFVSATNQKPLVAEIGALGEQLRYELELQSMAHIGLIGYPNAGKSTLLRAISRAKPKVAPYPFTTTKPHLGIVHYEDHEQIAVADLPGLIPDSHLNRGLGIQFLKHVERCCGMVYMIDASMEHPWEHYETLMFELRQFNKELNARPKLIVANKMDLPEAEENWSLIKQHLGEDVIPISAKMGNNLSLFLQKIRIIYDSRLRKEKADKNLVDEEND